MKTKNIKQSLLQEFGYTLPGAEYRHVYANRHHSGIVSVFSGSDWPRTPTVRCVLFEGLSDLTIMRLQLILTYGQTLPARSYKTWFMHLMAIDPRLSIHDFAMSIAADKKWVRDILKIRGESQDQMCVANAYAISKLRDINPLLARARTMDPVEFVPLAVAQAKEERLSRRRK